MKEQKKKISRFFQNVVTPSPLPAGYTAVECLLCYSGQYVNTGITLTNEDSIEIDMELDPSISESYAIMGCRDSFDSNNFTISKQSAGYGLCVDFNNSNGNTYRYSNDNYTKGRYTIYCNKTSRGILGVGSNNTVCNDVFTCSAPCYVGYWGAGYTNYAMIAKLYGAKIEGKFNGIPCYRDSDFVFGLFDTVSQTFFVNSGVGVFSAKFLTHPVGYTQIEYIECNGSQWFNTGVTSNGRLRFDMDCRPTALSSPESQVWFGGYNSNTSKNFYVGPGGSSNYDIYYKYYSNTDIRIAYTQSTYSSIKAITAGGVGVSNLYVFPNSGTSFTATDNDHGMTENLFSRNRTNTTLNQLPGKLKCYIVRIQKTGVNQRLYIPYKRNSDGVAGMYDLINNNFKTSMTGTDFIAGGDL